MVTKVRMTISSATRIGDRERNEDSFIVISGDSAPCGTLAFLTVADGIGGMGNGADASQLALKTAVDVFAAACSIASGTLSDIPHLLRFAVQKANAAVFQSQLENTHQRGMGTTCVAAAITGDALHVVSVGDSRAYILRDGVLIGVTEDEWSKLPDGTTVVNRAVGWQPLLPTEPISAPLRDGDIVVIATDGLTDVLSDNEIRGILVSTDLETAADALADAATRAQDADNTTVIVAKMG